MKTEHGSGRRRASVRGVIIAREVDAKLRYAVESVPNLGLWRFDDRLDLHEVV